MRHEQVRVRAVPIRAIPLILILFLAASLSVVSHAQKPILTDEFDRFLVTKQTAIGEVPHRTTARIVRLFVALQMVSPRGRRPRSRSRLRDLNASRDPVSRRGLRAAE